MTLRSIWVLTGSNSRHNCVAYFGRSNRGALNLKYKLFILSQTWPDLGEGKGLELGKDSLKTMLEDSGGSLRKLFSRLTNALVDGDNPGPKKVQEVHEQQVGILDVDQPKDFIYGARILDDLVLEAYLMVAVAALAKSNIHVQHQFSLPNQLAQAAGGTAGDTIPGQ